VHPPALGSVFGVNPVDHVVESLEDDPAFLLHRRRQHLVVLGELHGDEFELFDLFVFFEVRVDPGDLLVDVRLDPVVGTDRGRILGQSRAPPRLPTPERARGSGR